MLAGMFLSGVIAGDLPVPGQSDLPGSEITRSEVYVGGALWGLINGGADIYYEYGFDRMAIQEISWEGEEFRLELYRMDRPQSAFGIYSISRHGCEEGGVVVAGDCLNRYQYQFYSGNYYLSLINYSGSPRARELSLEIGRIVASRTGGGQFVLPQFFQQEWFIGFIDEIKVINGMLGLQNTLPSLAPVFEGLDDYAVYYLEMKADDEKAEIILVRTCPAWDDEITGAIATRLGEGGVAAGSGKNQILVIRSASRGALYEELVRLIPDEAVRY